MNLELRRAALEASGFVEHRRDGGVYYNKPDGGNYPASGWFNESRPWNMAPAVEIDPTAFWPWFLSWCERTGTDFELRRCKEKSYFRFHLYECGYRDDPGAVNTEAPELCEAGCEAVVEAAAVKAKEKA